MNYGHWTIPAEFNPNEHFGFIYTITNNINGKKYIGQKSFCSKQRIWTGYTGSCEPLNADIALHGNDSFSFTIESLHITPENLDLAEKELQIKNDVLFAILPNGKKQYYNEYIHTVGFRLSPEGYRTRNNAIIKSRAENKEILAKFTDRICEFSNDKTDELKICYISEFSKYIRGSLIDCIKLVSGKRSSLKRWYHTKDGIKLNAPHMDTKVYTFKFIETGEIFTGTQAQFKVKTQMSDSRISIMIHSDKKYSLGWHLCDESGSLMTEVFDKRIDIVGNKHHRADQNTYTISHKITNEIFVGTRADMRTKLNMSIDGSHILARGKSYKMWKPIITNKEPV